MTSTCIVVGAGIAGLTAAQALTARSISVSLLEKSRGPGGRMATKRTDAGRFDQGAQFLTAHSVPFRRMLEAWIREGLLRPWDIDRGSTAGRSPSYIGVPSMTAVPKHIGRGHHMLLQQRVQRVELSASGWLLQCDGGTTHSCSAIILTPPLPQSLQILETSGLRLTSAVSDELRSIEYNPCLALLVALDGPSAVPPPGGLTLGPEPVRWLADNHLKGIQTPEGSLTVHGGPRFSQEHYDSPVEKVQDLMLEAVKPYLGSPVRQVLLHRWRYSEPRATARNAAVLLREDPPLIIAGDSFGGPRVEGAALSGLAAADLLLSYLQGSSR